MTNIKTKGGRAVGVSCGRGHSGGRSLARAVSGWWECVGCGHLYSSDSVRAQLASPDAGDNMCGGLYSGPYSVAS